jgi:peptidoglycan/LPS O-acetylase OafA/YrhL
MAYAPSGVQGRLYEMDGLRGWASLSVMLSHLLFGVFVNAEPPALPPFLKPFLEPVLGGTLDVAVFFVLSGDALSASYWARRSRNAVVQLAVKRYFRLGIPILGSCLVVFVLDKSGLLFHRQAAPLLNVDDWLGQFLQKDYGIADVFKYAAFGVFCCHTQETSLNPFLGTMQAELLGSILVFGYLLLDPGIRLKSIVLLLILAICLGAGSFLACFPFGVLCGYCRSRGLFARLGRRRFAQILANLIACTALILGTYCNRVWQGWLPPSVIASCILVASIYVSIALKGFFATPFSRWLGRISFPLYLMHFPVIASFTSGSVVLVHAHDALGPVTIWLIIASSAVLSLLAAVLFLPAEILTARISDLVSRVAMRGGYADVAGQLAPSADALRRILVRLRANTGPAGTPAESVRPPRLRAVANHE